MAEAKKPKPATGRAKQPAGFPVVGIGASAGGLEALEQFFSHLPGDSGMAFVIVQHLDPSRHSELPEILSRFTTVPVREAANHMAVKPNTIYMIPPNASMGITKGKLLVQEPAPPPTIRLPIDLFLRSLAKDKGPAAIAVILSGTGSDGTLGVRAVKAELGTVFVQEPSTARYDGMPVSAINTGLADFVLPPEKMPGQLLGFIKHTPKKVTRTTARNETLEPPLQRVFAIVRARTGYDFSHYKPTTVTRRLERRLSVNQIDDIPAYAVYLRDNPEEIKALVKDFLISVTSFFRDPEAFEALKKQLEPLIKEMPEGSDFRAWVAGCATGEEAYSVVILIEECAEELNRPLQVQVFATDIDTDALNTARAGLYPSNIEADVSPERLKRFFIRQDKQYRIRKEIRDKVVFAPQNLIKDAPFSRMDLVCCRNLLIYLDGEVQKLLVSMLHYALKPGGILFLGPSETAGEHSELFASLDKKWKIYRRREGSAERPRLPIGAIATLRPQEPKPPAEAARPGLPGEAEKVFLDNFAPSFAVVDEKYRLAYVRGRTGNFLEITSGQPSLSIVDMAREGLRSELTAALYRASAEKREVIRRGIAVKLDGGFRLLDLTVAPLTQPGLPPGHLMVVLQDMGPAEARAKAGPAGRGSKKVKELERELKLSQENLKLSINELEATNEELKSTNEELQSNNEELQSSNEELDTSREELQSLNEELLTVNAELEEKNENLNKANNDLQNYLSRSDIAIIFLDEKLNIRTFTPASTAILNLREIDIGRPLDDITTRLDYGDFVEDARQVFRSLKPKEANVRLKSGYWYSMRILPYLTTQNSVAGLVISFLDINSQQKAIEQLGTANLKLKRTLNQLKESHERAESARQFLNVLLESIPEGVITVESGGRISFANKQAGQLFGVEPAGKTMEALMRQTKLLKPNGKPFPLEELPTSRTLAGQEPSDNVEVLIERPDGRYISTLAATAPLFDGRGKIHAAVGGFRDVTELKKVDLLKEDFIGMVSHELRTPLTVVIGSLLTAVSPGVSDKDAREMVKCAVESAKSLGTILDNLLELSRYRADRLEMRMSGVAMHEAVQAVLDKLKPIYQRQFVNAVPGDLPLVRADKIRLERILYNLLDNGAKYSPEGSRVTVSARRDGENVAVSITDRGKGISEAEKRRLFEPFSRFEKTSTSTKGVGLGLVVCKHLVEAHGGHIKVESAENRGSTFSFTLPLSKE